MAGPAARTLITRCVTTTIRFSLEKKMSILRKVPSATTSFRKVLEMAGLSGDPISMVCTKIHSFLFKVIIFDS
jgi:hypothetical protein